jgi:Ca-activated chloride channel family protein
MVALATLVVALARPRMPGAEVAGGEGVDIMLTLDMSSSMNAIDLSSAELQAILQSGKNAKGERALPSNRFVIARELLKQFITERNAASHDRIGLVVFGNEAWLRYPLTHDHARLIHNLNELVLDSGLPGPEGKCANGCTISGNGTAIGDALGRSFNQLRRSEGTQGKIIILITDGKEQGGSLKAEAMARHLRDLPPDPNGEKVRVYTFLVGGAGEVWLPDTDRLGRQYRTREGLPAYAHPQQPFPTDPELLKQIAEATGGKFYASYNEAKFKEDVADLKRTAFESVVERPEVDVLEWPLLIGLLIVLGEQLLRFTLFRSIA